MNNGKRGVLEEARLYYDPFDRLAWCQEWRFALADYLIYDQGENVPVDVRPSIFGPDADSYAYCQLVVDDADTEACQYALKILDRYREWLRIAGKDY